MASIVVLAFGGPQLCRFVRGHQNAGSMPHRIDTCDRQSLLGGGPTATPSIWTAAKATADGQQPLVVVVPGPFVATRVGG